MTFEGDQPLSDRETLILALVEGDLDPGQEASALAGLDPQTMARVRAMRRHRAALRSVAEVAPPAGLLDRVAAVLEREAVTGPALDGATFPIDSYRTPSWSRRFAVAAGLALMAGGLGYWSLRLSSTPTAGPGVQIAGTTGTADRVFTDMEATRKSEPVTDVASSVASEPALASARQDEPEMSLVDFGDPLPSIEPSLSSHEAAWASASFASAVREELMGPASAPLGVFSDLPTSLDLEDAAMLANEGRLVIRVRADRPALAAARLLAQADSRADKGRLWRLMPCPPSDFSTAVESAMPPVRTGDDPSGLTVPFRSLIRPAVETTLSVELDPSVAMLAIVQAELESISEGAVILDVLDCPVSMAPPCSDEGGLRRWTSAPSSAVHSVVVPVVVEGE